MKKRAPKQLSALWSEWAATCERRPNKIVLIEAATKSEWTAEDLTRKAFEFTELLAPYSGGEKVAFRLMNGLEWMAFFLALQRAGLAAIPLDAAMPASGCLETARRFGAGALYVDGSLQRLGEGTRAPGCSCVKVTSGSDGTPKMVICRAEHLLADGRQVVETAKIRAGDRNLAVIPLGHSYGLGNLVMPLIQQGTAMVTASEYVPRQLVGWIRRHRVTVMPVVPALLRVLAALPGDSKLGSVRTVISAGAVLSPETARAFFLRFRLKIHNFYGSSETGAICYDRSGNASLTGRSVGKPAAGVSITLKAGLITVKSAAVATRSGAWKLPDVAEWNARGELMLLGRRGQEANIGGKKVHPREVEQALRGLPGVTDAAVWVRQERGRDVVAAAVETGLTRGEVERAMAEKLPAWKLPKNYLVAAELPRTARGKLDSVLLRERIT